jgi:hypothetical protein
MNMLKTKDIGRKVLDKKARKRQIYGGRSTGRYVPLMQGNETAGLYEYGITPKMWLEYLQAYDIQNLPYNTNNLTTASDTLLHPAWFKQITGALIVSEFIIRKKYHILAVKSDYVIAEVYPGTEQLYARTERIKTDKIQDVVPLEPGSVFIETITSISAEDKEVQTFVTYTKGTPEDQLLFDNLNETDTDDDRFFKPAPNAAPDDHF